MKKTINTLLLLAIISLTVLSCRKDPAQKMIDTSSDFASGTITESEFMKSFIAYFTVDKLESGSYIFEDSAVYQTDEDQIRMIKPWTMNISLKSSISSPSLYACEDSARAVLSHSRGFILFDKGGKELAAFTLPVKEKKSSVKGAAVINGDVIYFMNNRLYRYDPVTEKSDIITKEEFKPVYDKFFDVKFSWQSDYLFFAYGSAGSYKLSGIKISDSRVMIKDLTTASSRFYFDNEEGLFLTGSTGEWALSAITLPDKNRTKIHTFTELREIVLYKEGYLFQTSKGFFIGSGTEKPEWSGFQWILAGKYRNTAVIKIGGEYIFADLPKLIEANRMLVEAKNEAKKS